MLKLLIILNLERITKRTEVDDSSNEPVTSTTHDDESAAVSGTAESLASEVKLLGGASVIPNNDDLKVVIFPPDKSLVLNNKIRNFLIKHA